MRDAFNVKKFGKFKLSEIIDSNNKSNSNFNESPKQDDFFEF